MPSENRHERYNETLAYIREQERSGNLLVIRPEAPLNIGAVERHPEELERVYQIGRKEGEKRLSGSEEISKKGTPRCNKRGIFSQVAYLQS